MLIPLLSQENKELLESISTQQTTTVQETSGPIKVPLSTAKKPKDRVASKPKKDKEAAKAALEASKLLELIETINRIFKDEDCELITTQEQLLNFLRQQEVFGLDTETTGLLWYRDKIAGYSLGTKK